MSKLLMEAVYRTATGPVMPEDVFENEILPSTLAAVQSKYRIEWDPDDPTMTDPDLADAIFKAGKEYLLEAGLYCKNTKRVVKFTEQEINEAISTARKEVTIGSGRQEITIKPRAPGDSQHLYTFPPAGGRSTNTELYKLFAISVMQEPTCDGVIPMPLYSINKMKNIAETPAQTLACLTEARLMNEAAARAGKPGLWFGFPMTSTTPHTLISTFASGLYNKQNCALPVQIIQEMRIDYDRLNLAFHAEQIGLEPWMSSCPALYAYLSGPEQGAIQIIAHTLAMLAYSGGAITQAMSVSVHGPYYGNDIFWCNSAAALAAERNLKLPWITFGRGSGLGADSPLNERAWYETACAVINASISGVEGLWLAGGSTALEARWAGELARASAGLSPKDGTEIIRKLMKIADSMESVPDQNVELNIEELYDISTLQPKKVALDHYHKLVRSMKEFGLNYITWDF
ncbi:monomethylamine:corrinoid methyltransferase [Denitratisoma oestradiolicum]|uniref:Uncharacterized protein n=1 Tax=Denitratisoma oestradiolicum TaxID=311182 RepID=A0A6S6XU31_9PROT|nr:monomethylamine:corrinoid methyltransferase [Denitratisoma oestradiolicum]TWO79019.1 hypothetical protein CBW56_16985 [Denitratisoma oestradiolicum]CAB1368320.1 conserved protein of unknown function [Denitratisoma oestradiolicum]